MKKGGNMNKIEKVFFLFLALVCFLLVGCANNEDEVLEIISATGFEIDGASLYREVPNSTTTYSFINQIKVSTKATWGLYTDITASNKILSKTIDLLVGDNIVYILVTKADDIKLYKVVIKRLAICDVSFDTNGGEVMEVQNVEEGNMFNLPTVEPTKAGYTFKGWEDANGDTIVFPIKIEEDIIIKAKWKANENTLVFNANGGTGEMDNIFIETNGSIKLPKNAFSKIGYSFDGWSASLDGEIEYFDKANYTMGTQESYTLYAQWDKLPAPELYFGLKEDNTYELIGCAVNPTEIYIPKKYLGKPITSIKENALANLSNLTSVTMSSNVTSIGLGAFSGCDNLTSIIIPRSVTNMGKNVFYDCDKLKVYIKAESKPIGWDKDWNADYRPVVWGYVSNHITTNGIEYGISLIDSNYGVTITGYQGSGREVIIPTEIAGYPVIDITSSAFFKCTDITKVKISNTVTSIGVCAFFYCSSLESLIIPKSVEKIEGDIVYSCSYLTIYVEAEEKPAEWYYGWNHDTHDVVWGYRE
jgi:uncharacterized repeat protein (TIGR02543 family)